MACGHIAEILQARFRVVWGLLLLWVFFVNLVPLGIFVIDLNGGLWHVILSSAADVKLGGTALEHMCRT